MLALLKNLENHDETSKQALSAAYRWHIDSVAHVHSDSRCNFLLRQMAHFLGNHNRSRQRRASCVTCRTIYYGSEFHDDDFPA